MAGRSRRLHLDPADLRALQRDTGFEADIGQHEADHRLADEIAAFVKDVT